MNETKMSYKEHPRLLLGEILFWILVTYVVYRLYKYHKAKAKKWRKIVFV